MDGTKKKVWRLIARFPTEDDVYFVKMNVTQGSLRCSCDEFALSSVKLKFLCRHTRFCHEHVIDEMGTVELDGLMPKGVRKNERAIGYWVERHVKEYFVDRSEDASDADGTGHRGNET